MSVFCKFLSIVSFPYFVSDFYKTVQIYFAIFLFILTVVFLLFFEYFFCNFDIFCIFWYFLYIVVLFSSSLAIYIHLVWLTIIEKILWSLKKLYEVGKNSLAAEKIIGYFFWLEINAIFVELNWCDFCSFLILWKFA